MIEIKDVTMQYPVPKRYIDILRNPFKTEKFTALEKCNLTISEGEKIAFLGSNGAGKTTLLKLIGGLLYPSQGNISIHGYNTQSHNVEARKNVGFVINEERSFYWRLTGRQNLAFFGALDNLKGQVLHEKISQLIDLVGLTRHADKLFAGYSSGMKQKLAIARGLLADPKILILDEPTRTLDPIATEEVKELIFKKIHSDRERTLLIATHNLDEAKALCSKICIMKEGKVLHYKSKEETLRTYANLLECYNHVITNGKEKIAHYTNGVY
ncbi:ABC transporter ATP-binding protein [Ohtaekwangia sp.]|uniref:ABC transporter ATP-binding protein n=1 Tax=Ohtaekwangia sp. TaxID=2066019 RepID=UPI002FDDE593